MKIGVSSYSFAKHIGSTDCTYIDICNLAKEFGFDGIEFVDLDFHGFPLKGDMMSCAKEIREHCEKIGLEICAYTVGGDFLKQDIDAEVERLFRCVDVAEALGAKVMRHDVCYALPTDRRFTWQDAIEVMTPHIRRVTEYAKAKGIRTCTENHGYIFQSPERVEALMRAVNNENYGWLIDMGNFLCADADPLHATVTAVPYAFHVHAKDFLFKSADTPKPYGFFNTAGQNYIRGTVIGHGIVPVVACVNVLKKAQYNGFISVEFEGMEDCLPAIRAGLYFLRSVV